MEEGGGWRARADTRIADLAAATRPLHWKDTGKPNTRLPGRTAEPLTGRTCRDRAPRQGSKPEGPRPTDVTVVHHIGLGSREPGPSGARYDAIDERAWGTISDA